MNEVVHIDHLPGRTLTVEGKEHLYFSGTSYLGMARNEAFQKHLLEGIRLYGSNYSSSRISNLKLQIFEESEAYLAQFTGAETALTMSSGFLTGQMVVRLLENKGRFLYAPRTHPALWRTQADFYDGSFNTWVATLPETIGTFPENDLILITNSLDPLLAQPYDFSWVAHLPASKSITLVVDDSHGFGVLGKEGAGIFSKLQPYTNIRLLVLSSLGKAFGIPGGVILGEKETIDQFKANPFFGGSSPVIPAYLYAFLQSKAIYQQERERLFQNIQLFTSHIAGLSIFDYFSRYPVYYTRQHQLCTYLKDNGVLISSFPYPSPQDDLITRVIISSLHTEEDIHTLAKLIEEFSS
ncbi:aminotransferase class I/II-fold pyridoxal phosphate-dependent enzyme [Rhodocytophaga aerolata]|uniref:Aminotransferase class I/II-fold pyridoxal phosphate-dependent enzyme n=1 Tax=Rhodocytophaga aerolata TaxID=455078 RepID=A0ABT8R891_9BACT|nr:aminotransferase class I/II-fold pyridoxal phosphate-dependent enzyme [Rhodocytophaga aerolata]MDO1446890.1 aminotransferase class I/II-fold pyridoxal phosphate-dependent enzyme [Rhodocytophaga aerolata]